MQSYFEYITTVVLILVVWMLIAFRKTSIKDYFKSKDGKGAAGGIIKAVLFAAVMGCIVFLTGCNGSYINDASVYAGLERTNKLSPMCEDRGPDNRTTSNLGAKLNIYESRDGRFRTNANYTHHSCAFSPDDKSYDAVGFVAEYKFWQR